MTARLFSLSGAASGPWRVRSIDAVRGATLPAAAALDVRAGSGAPDDALWSLHGMSSNARYLTREEKTRLLEAQEELGRAGATHAALIPIRKSAAWWALTQDERRAIVETQLQHIRIGLRYLPAVARRLLHCRDLSETAPFHFLTWFEFAPDDEPAFDALLVQLRASPEWRYVEREVDIRLTRA